LETEIIREIKEVLDSDKLSGFRGDVGLTEGGPNVQRLEASFRDYFNIKHAIAFNSATAALHAACEALKIDVVIVTPFSFTSSVSCVRQAAGYPLFQDINPHTYCMDVTNQNSNSDFADAIIPVHLFGGCADMDAIMSLGIPVIEDAAQAIGSKYKGKLAGTIGDCGIFSFNQSKTISCGEGGMLITNDGNIAYMAKLVRNHGELLDYKADIVGYNYRMTEIEAIITYNRFLKLDEIIEQRKENVEYFRKLLLEIDEVKPQWINPDVDYSWYVYSFEIDNNHEIASGMTKAGIPLRGGYITQPLNIVYNQVCPVCEKLWSDRLIVTDVIGKDTASIDNFVNTLKGVINGYI